MKIINIDKDARIKVLEDDRNYILEYTDPNFGKIIKLGGKKFKCKNRWILDGYFTNLTSLSTDYLNNAPQRSKDAIKGIEGLVQVIKDAEMRITKLFKHNENITKGKK